MHDMKSRSNSSAQSLNDFTAPYKEVINLSTESHVIRCDTMRIIEEGTLVGVINDLDN